MQWYDTAENCELQIHKSKNQEKKRKGNSNRIIHSGASFAQPITVNNLACHRLSPGDRIRLKINCYLSIFIPLERDAFPFVLVLPVFPFKFNF